MGQLLPVATFNLKWARFMLFALSLSCRATFGTISTGQCDPSSFQQDTDIRDGQGIGHAGATDPSDCCEQCSNEEGCLFWTCVLMIVAIGLFQVAHLNWSGLARFAPDTNGGAGGTCWFKANDNNPSSSPGLTSGSVGEKWYLFSHSGPKILLDVSANALVDIV